MNKTKKWQCELGAFFIRPKTLRFNVWAPHHQKAEVILYPARKKILLHKDAQGYHSGILQDAKPGLLYQYLLDGELERPDPASRFQPQGVHGPSCVVDPGAFRWSDSKWKGIKTEDLIFYEIHTGTFTPEGTFEAAITKIPHLKELGITCVEIMPVAQFPGKRNWGYDGAYLYAVQNSYGGPDGLKKLVNACHRAGLAVCLDVVYNHFGPEGSYLRDFGPYFTPKYHTPWGDAVNYDDVYSGEVRRFITDNLLYWLTEFHIDVFRLDAVHAIYDFSARPVLKELQEKAQTQARNLGRRVSIIAESDLNDPRLIQKSSAGLDGQWSDDFHHAAHTCLTGETQGFYSDFGTLADLAKAVREGFIYDGKYAPSRKRGHGAPLGKVSKSKLVVCVQNHDQVGNRAFGERLGQLVSFEREKLAAVLLLMAPNLPLIFMGQEYGEKTPFQYFIDHEDAGLVKAVQEGRKKEFAAFGWKNVPDPAAEQAFKISKLHWESLKQKEQRELFGIYKTLIQLRQKYQLLKQPYEVWFEEEKKWLGWAFKLGKTKRLAVFISLSNQKQTLPVLKQKKFKEIFRTWKKAAENGKKSALPPESAVVGFLS